MLSQFDDYPIHQTAEPIAHYSSADRNAYDRYWFNGFANDGEFYFGIGAALYPNLGIMDASFSIVRDGVQHSFHATRRAPRERSRIQVGPFRIDILEPMQRLRVVVDPNETGIGCDLLWTPRTANIEEGRQTMRRGSRILMDATRFNQFGRWQGEITYDGTRLAVDPARVLGVKDRSWGVRPVGDHDPGGAPWQELPQVFFIWAPLHWKDRCTHAGIFEDGLGRITHWDGMIVPAYDTPAEIPGIEDPAVKHLASIGQRIDYLPGTRRARGAVITMTEPGGVRHDITLEPLLCFRMKGLGYNSPEWGHGQWKGELVIGSERWRSDELDPMALDNQHVQQVVRARWGNEEGVGVLEQLCLGAHASYGFKEFLDPA